MEDDFERSVDRLAQYRDDAELGQGFAGMVTDRQAGSITLFWHGDLPPVVQAEVKAVSAGAVVYVQQAEHSARQLRSAAQRVMSRLGQGRGVVTVSLLPDGSGVEVGTDRPVRAALIQSIAGPVPVMVVDRSQPVPPILRESRRPSR